MDLGWGSRELTPSGSELPSTNGRKAFAINRGKQVRSQSGTHLYQRANCQPPCQRSVLIEDAHHLTIIAAVQASPGRHGDIIRDELDTTVRHGYDNTPQVK